MKSRFWSFIVYPDSVIENWIDTLVEMGCVFAISPFHDRDINANGEPKKPHYHILLQFEGPTTYKNVKENICDLVKGTIPKKVISMRGYYRYLTHMDNPEKAQYDVADIKCYGGFKCELTTSEITYIKSLIVEDIYKNNIVEYNELIKFYMDMGDYDRFEIVSNYTYFFDKIITSVRHSIVDDKKQQLKSTK